MNLNLIIQQNKKVIINPINAFIFTLSLRNKELRTSLLNSEFIPADGQSIIWALNFLNNLKLERLTGIDLMYALFETAVKNNYRIFLFGSTDETLHKIYFSVKPEIKKTIIGMENGYFESNKLNKIVEKINITKPDIIFLGLNSPNKEILSLELKTKTEANIILSVGGSFEILAGNKKRAPHLFQTLGLEWLYRLMQEPRRLFKRYLITNVLFVTIIIIEKIKRLIKT